MFIPKYLSRICRLHLRRSLCRRHLRNIAFTSVPSVTPCAYYIRLLVYHSIFRKNPFFYLYCWLFLFPLRERQITSRYASRKSASLGEGHSFIALRFGTCTLIANLKLGNNNRNRYILWVFRILE